MFVDYNILLERVGHFLFGIRSSFSADQTKDIEQCIRDGLHDVYVAHTWSFFRPVEDLATTAPYSTGTVTISSGVVTLTGGTFPSWSADGLLKVSNKYYSVASRDSDTQITLDNTTVTEASSKSFQLGQPEIPMDAKFEAVANDSDLTYYPDQNRCYPPVQQRHDQTIRRMQQDNPYYDQPIYYSVRNVLFDPTIGSRKVLALYPTPDAEYVFRVPMVLRPTMIDSTNLYPVGGETLTQVITEACLAAAERNFDERGNQHTQQFMYHLPLAIKADQEKSSPTSLGPDMPKGEGYYSGMHDWDHWYRSRRIGTIRLDGSNL